MIVLPNSRTRIARRVATLAVVLAVGAACRPQERTAGSPKVAGPLWSARGRAVPGEPALRPLGTPVGLRPIASTACAGALRDDRDRTRLTLRRRVPPGVVTQRGDTAVRLAVEAGDYAVPLGRYGTHGGEYVRIECASYTAIAIVPEMP